MKGRKGTMPYVLWIVQALLALLLLFTGGIKLVLPLEMLTEQTPLPGVSGASTCEACQIGSARRTQ